MRKFYQDYSLTGVVLIISTLALGFIFRFLGLSETSAWGDEVASLFYAENLIEIFKHESHTPLYYFICKLWTLVFGKTVLSLRYLFITLSFLLLSLSGHLLIKNKQTGFFLGLIVLWWLWPTDIIFSRQARHYGLYAELSFFFLIFWRFRDQYSGKILFFLASIIQFLHPFMIIPVWFLALYDYGRRKISRSVLFLVLASSVPLFLYYGLRFIFYGQVKVLSNINWIKTNPVTYLQELFLLFAGDSFPFQIFYPLSFSTSAFFIGCVLIVQLIKKTPQESLYKFLLLLLLSLLATEICSLVFTNVRVARYCMYLVPFFLYALVDSNDESSHHQNLLRSGALFFILVCYNIFIFKPWSFYEWDDQHVSSAKATLEKLPARDLVVCGNRYQLDYYFKKENLTCFQVAFPLLRAKKPFYLLDINGNDKLLLAYLLQEADISYSQSFRQAQLIAVDPRR